MQDAHVVEPGLVVVDVAAADDDTALAFQAALAVRWTTATAIRTVKVPPGEPGVRLRCYLGPCQELPAAGMAGPQSRPLPDRAHRGEPRSFFAEQRDVLDVEVGADTAAVGRGGGATVQRGHK
ncbi:DUF6207 family protein [Streptomyces hirsutus]|uniref:DUF6207 family protein n=1 Tax=Streptomyces hirsutus TaxID=35620 RepID=UPI0023E3A1FB|nr:DUF6207 family protein [Streptomyces hirsutus]